MPLPPPPRSSWPAPTESEILDVAQDVLAAGGPDTISIRRIAAALQTPPNAVYRYFPDRGAVARALVERMLAEVDTAVPDPAREVRAGSAPGAHTRTGEAAGGEPGEGAWRAGIEALAIELRLRLIARPGLVRLALSAPLDGPNALRLGERLLRLLAEAGLDRTAAARGSYVIAVYALGAVALETADVAGTTGPLPPEEDRIAARRAGFAGIGAHSFPRTRAVLDVRAGWVGTEQYRWGLRRVLTGLVGAGLD